MHANAELINRFYEAFAGRDAAAMGACYHADARFSDPVFPDLDAEGVRGMWEMLCSRASDDFRVEFRDVTADDTTGSAHWEAWYEFSATGRQVHNVIDATFELRDGLIVRHTDKFDFYAWSRMALGAPGLLLGWTPLVRNKVRGQAGGQLKKWLERSRAEAADAASK